MNRLHLEVNDDIEYQLKKHTNKKLTINQLINKILQEWVDGIDDKQYDKSKPNKKILPPEELVIESIELGELNRHITAWAKRYGEHSLLYTDAPTRYLLEKK